MENKSGMVVVQDKVLLLPDKVSDTVFGIVKPEIVKAQETWAQTRATVIDVGPNAFETWEEPTPKAGDKVYVCRYAGIDGIKGADGEFYKIAPDVDITAIIYEEPEEEIGSARKPIFKKEA
jgi:co-chaperonin GroES (HSP10)